jgi:hypothetical protein
MYERDYSDSGGFGTILVFVFAIITGLAIMMAIVEGIGDRRLHSSRKETFAQHNAARAHDLSLIRPVTGQEECLPGSHWIGYFNGTTLPIGKMHFTVRGYIQNRVDNVVSIENPQYNVSIDRIVQPQEIYGECVKLHGPEIAGAKYYAQAGHINYLSEFEDYLKHNPPAQPALPYRANCSAPDADGTYRCHIEMKKTD